MSLSFSALEFQNFLFAANRFALLSDGFTELRNGSLEIGDFLLELSDSFFLARNLRLVGGDSLLGRGIFPLHLLSPIFQLDDRLLAILPSAVDFQIPAFER